MDGSSQDVPLDHEFPASHTQDWHTRDLTNSALEITIVSSNLRRVSIKAMVANLDGTYKIDSLLHHSVNNTVIGVSALKRTVSRAPRITKRRREEFSSSQATTSLDSQGSYLVVTLQSLPSL